ncbi:MAG TPA: hypothetical protein VKT80_09265, partial [Chloroflexota bacterium]|nr:hypothetical protein [Chloroflexota bacterium]
QPIVAFLSANARDAAGQATWRYLTLGFGEQAGLLHARTDAGTPDGYFYTARRQPFLTQSGIASLDYSLLWDSKAIALRSLLLQPAPEHLRWVFTEDPGYQKILGDSGWRQTETLADGVGVWETNQAVAPVDPNVPQTSVLAIWWGIAPLAALAASFALGLKSRLVC